MIRHAAASETDHVECPGNVRHSELNRRQFAATTGALLGALAVGEHAMGQTQTVNVAGGADAPKRSARPPGAQGTPTGPWDPAALISLREWDPKWMESCERMTTDPWTSNVLPLKLVELLSIAWHAACTNLNTDGTRRHIRAALDAGATRDEILVVLRAATCLSIHTCSLGAPILLEEARAAGITPTPKKAGPTPACDAMKAAGQWNTAWEPFFELSPDWTEQFMATGGGIYLGAVFSPRDAELLSIMFDTSITHMYAPGTRRHIRAALKLGATMEEIFEVLKIGVALGAQACNLGVPILAEELAGRSLSDTPPQTAPRP